jgi:NADH-quinone oxidoreductase subunit J
MTMLDVQSALFYAFSAVLLFAAFRVITARNPVHAALYLVLAFFQASGVWMLLKAEFLSISLVLVYVGAVMVLFLFVVMMLDIDVDSLREGFWRHFPLAATVGAVIALELAAVLLGGFRMGEAAVAAPTALTPSVFAASATAVIASNSADVASGALDAASQAVSVASQAADVGHVVIAQVSNSKSLGVLLYTDYLYPVQIAAVILLVALIIAIALTLRTRKDSKAQDPSQQVRVKAKDRVELVKIAPVKAAAPAEQEKQA